jgi:EF hand
MNTKLKFLLSCAGLAMAAVGATSVVAQTAPAPGQRAHMHGKGFEALDTNNDQLVSRDEAKGRPRLEKNFDVIDTNRDGQLSRDELKAFRAARHAQRK